MQTFTTDYAAQHLSELLTLVRNGETILLSMNNHPIARLMPVGGDSDSDSDVPPSEVEEAFHGD